jgi:hypothetical protein
MLASSAGVVVVIITKLFQSLIILYNLCATVNLCEVRREAVVHNSQTIQKYVIVGIMFLSTATKIQTRTQ